jgi:hypothetical protein
MRKLLSIFAATLTAAIIAGGVAWSAFIPFLTPNSPAGIACSEPSQSLYCYNQIIGTVNGYLGLVAALPGPIASTATTGEQTLATTPLPPGLLSVAGQTLRLRCGGTTASNGNTKSAKLYFGTGATISTGNFSTSGAAWELELLVTAGTTIATANSVYIGRGTQNTTVVAPVSGNNLTDNLSNAVTAKCTVTQGSASAADMTLEDFIIEQIK